MDRKKLPKLKNSLIWLYIVITKLMLNTGMRAN